MTAFTGFDEAVVVDVETTGLDPNKDRIISAALVRANFSDLKKDPALKGETLDVIAESTMSHPERNNPRASAYEIRPVADKSPFCRTCRATAGVHRGSSCHRAATCRSTKVFSTLSSNGPRVKTLARNKSFCTMRRFQDFNHGRRRGNKLDDVVAVLGVKGRESTKHDAVEDTRLAWQVACLFYMMDNRIKIPGGKPTPPTRTATGRRTDRHTSTFGTGAAFLAVALIALLVWWLYR